MIINKIFERINRRSPILFQSPWIGAIGNCAEEIFYGLLRARRERKKVLFIFPYDAFWKLRFSKRGKGINRHLLRIENEFRVPYTHALSVFLSGWVSVLYYGFKTVAWARKRLVGKNTHENYITPNIGELGLWCPEDAGEFSRVHVKKFRWREQMGSPLPVRLPEKWSQKGCEIKAEMGLPEGGWYVCLHVREGGFYDHVEGPIAKARNASIQNYRKAIELITRAGGWVVRMGDRSMTPLPSMERVIDYAHSGFKGAFMDIYLIQECRFYIGSQSGIWSVASLFQKPMLTPNMAEWLDSFPERLGDLGILKHVYSKTRMRMLSVKETVEELAKYQYRTDWVREYDYVENTPDEIYELVKEYMDNEGQYHLSDLQYEFNDKRVEYGYRVLEREILSRDPDKDRMIKYHMAARLDGCGGTLSHGFLEKNWMNVIDVAAAAGQRQ